MADKQLRLVLLGDATSVQKALKTLDAELAQTGTAVNATGQNLAQNEAKVESFGKQFLKLGLAIGAAALFKEAAQGVADYTKNIQESSAQILGATKSQSALNSAFAFADSELKAGRSAYSDTVAAIAELTPTAQRAGLSVTDLYKTVQLLSALNSGPGGGVEGSVIAINNALAGQFTSLQERFNLPIAGIQAAVKAGVPALQAINDALAKEGVTMDLVTAKSKTAANQQKILFDTLAKLGSDSGGKETLDLYTTALVGLNKELQSPAIKQFASGLREITELASAGEATQDFGLKTAEAFFLVADAYNNMIKAISGGHINIDKPLAEFRAQIVADEGKTRAIVQEHIGKPVADELSGKAPGSPIAPSTVAGYGKDVVAHFLQGLSSSSVDEVQQIAGQFGDLFKDAAGKDDPAKLSNAYVVLSRALAELASKGQLTDDTMRDLSATFGLQTPDVYKLIAAYNQYQQALSGVALAQIKVQGATAATAVVTEQAAGDLKGYQAALTLATSAANAHAAASAAVVEGLQDTLKGVQDTAEAAARAGQAQLAGLQDGLDSLQNAASQHAAARQAEIAAAQAQLSAASQQRSNDQALLNAALNGELEYEEQILDGLTDQQRAIAAKWQAEIDGQRRAKEGADQKVTDLTRQGHLDDKKSLHEINDLRASGHEKEARAAERALAARQKQRAAALTLAQADAAVADDEFAAAEEKVKKEGKDQEVKDVQAEKAAQSNLTRIQAAADAQKAADDAAIKAQQDQITNVQKAQKAEADRYADQERGIQREIDKTTEAAKVQAAKDKKTIDDATTILNDRKTYWDQELLKAGQATTQAQNQEKSAENFANHMKDAFDAAEKISKLDFSNVTNAANALAGVQPGAPSGDVGAQGGGRDTRSGAAQASGAPPPTPADQARAAAAGLPALIDGQRYPYPPEGYHAEYDQAGYRWYVPDGHTLAEYNQLGGTGSNKAPLSSVRAGSPLAGVGPIGGPGLQFQRARLGGEPAADGARQTTIHINLPNVRDLGDPAQRATIWREIEREWDDVERGGHVKREIA